MPNQTPSYGHQTHPWGQLSTYTILLFVLSLPLILLVTALTLAFLITTDTAKTQYQKLKNSPSNNTNTRK